MREKLINQFRPNYAVPGATLLDTLEELGMFQAELAQRMRHPLKTINEIQGRGCHHTRNRTPMEKVLGIPTSFWNSAERNFRETLARLDLEKRLQTETLWLKEVPVRQMAKWASQRRLL